MRRYDESVEVRRGLVAGQEAPEQFVWRDRLWVVRDIVAHWTETGAWWELGRARAVVGSEATEPAGTGAGAGTGTGVATQAPMRDLLAEREVWRVEAARGERWWRERADADAETEGYGVFDLAFDWGGGSWALVSSLD